MDYRIILGTSDNRASMDVVGSGRGAIEAVLDRGGARVAWAEVFDDARRPVARKTPGRRGLTGYPSAAGWGHVCSACRTLAGQPYPVAYPHPGLGAPGVGSGSDRYLCRNCRTEMGADAPADVKPRSWAILAWPDMLP